MESDRWTVETPRLVLRPVATEDAAATAALMSSAVSARLLSWPSPMSHDEARERIVAAQTDLAAGAALDLAILVRDPLRLAGWIGMRRTDRPGEATLGFWLGEPFQGGGLMTEAAAAAMPAFERLFGGSTIRAGVQPHNAASISILRRLGFLFVGTGTSYAPARGRSEHVLLYEAPFDAAARGRERRPISRRRGPP